MATRALLMFTLLVFAGIGVFSLLAHAFTNFGWANTLMAIIAAAALALFYKMGRDDGKMDCLLQARPKAKSTQSAVPAAASTQRQEPRF